VLDLIRLSNWSAEPICTVFDMIGYADFGLLIVLYVLLYDSAEEVSSWARRSGRQIPVCVVRMKTFEQ